MASSNGNASVEYDLNLLAMAPPPTKEYPKDPLLQPQPSISPIRIDLETGGPRLSSYAPSATASSVEPKDVSTTASISTKPYPPEKPFYRTKKGIIILVIVIIVILAAIVGGAVGGAKVIKSSVQGIPQQISTSISGERAGQGGAVTVTGPQGGVTTVLLSTSTSRTQGPTGTGGTPVQVVSTVTTVVSQGGAPTPATFTTTTFANPPTVTRSTSTILDVTDAYVDPVVPSFSTSTSYYYPPRPDNISRVPGG